MSAGAQPLSAAEAPGPVRSAALYADVLECLDAQLGRVLEGVERRAAESEDLSLRGLVVTDAEVRRLLAPDAPAEQSFAGALAARADPHLAAARDAGPPLPLELARDRFALTPFEVECVLVCLAPELDAKYEKLYGFLNDDVTRRYPSLDLLLRLLAPPQPGGALALRRRLLPEAPLRHARLLVPADDGRPAGASSERARCLRVDPGVVRFLLEEPGSDPELAEVEHRNPYPASAEALWEALPACRELAVRLRAGFEARDRQTPLVCILRGRPGSGRAHVARTACAAVGLDMIAIEAGQLLRHPDPVGLLMRALRDSVLHAAPVYLAGADALASEPERGPDLRRALLRGLDELGWLLLIGVERSSVLRSWFARPRCIEVELAQPTRGERQHLWLSLLEGERRDAAPGGQGADELEALAEALAAKFRLTPGQLAEAHQRAAGAPRRPDERVDWRTALHRAAAQVSAPRLGELATPIAPHYRLDQVVLPPSRLELLRDVVLRVRHRRTVLETWRFEGALARGRGLNVLFAGPSGTGKTMSAEAIANELGLDLFRIDLAAVVSKYIGETEKNLSRIFREAEGSDAILFFDEADALMGKRSEVRDSHDRYANIEVSYLLQKIEGYEGLAILATNLRQNLDEAFLRRIHVSIDFPIPGPADRLRIWQRALPDAAPRGDDIDLAFLARAFEIAGGSIVNIGLGAAYLAADAGTAIGMTQLIRATERELTKLGRRSIRDEFGPYYELLEPGARPAGPPGGGGPWPAASRT